MASEETLITVRRRPIGTPALNALFHVVDATTQLTARLTTRLPVGWGQERSVGSQERGPVLAWAAAGWLPCGAVGSGQRPLRERPRRLTFGGLYRLMVIPARVTI